VEKHVKLYSYSSELLAFVEAKWVIAKCVTGGIIIGTVILFCVIILNQSEGNAIGSRPVNTLAAENDFLRQQLSLMSPRLSKLEMQARQLNERSDKLHMLLHRRKVVVDSVSSFTDATKEFKLQSLSLNHAAKRSSP
jgi:hypothetical protein